MTDPNMTKNLSVTRDLTMTALLSAILAVLGTFKIPGILPGTEFQLSAPFAICIVACFGFRTYLKIGVIASIINLILGTHTIFNVTVAMVFRIVAGGVISCFGVNPVTLVVSGPIGTAAGRVVLGTVMGTNPLLLIAAAAPGMCFTSVASLVMYPVMRRIVLKTYGIVPAMARQK